MVLKPNSEHICSFFSFIAAPRQHPITSTHRGIMHTYHFFCNTVASNGSRPFFPSFFIPFCRFKFQTIFDSIQSSIFISDRRMHFIIDRISLWMACPLPLRALGHGAAAVPGRDRTPRRRHLPPPRRLREGPDPPLRPLPNVVCIVLPRRGKNHRPRKVSVLDWGGGLVAIRINTPPFVPSLAARGLPGPPLRSPHLPAEPQHSRGLHFPGPLCFSKSPVGFSSNH